MSYECDNDNHDIGCKCPGRTPDFRHLVVRDLTEYFVGRAVPRVDAERRANDLMRLVDRECDKLASVSPYPSNTKCVCGDLIHPDMPSVEVEADGGLFHWNEAGGGHRADASLT
jgi:hypothetical protein